MTPFPFPATPLKLPQIPLALPLTLLKFPSTVFQLAPTPQHPACATQRSARTKSAKVFDCIDRNQMQESMNNINRIIMNTKILVETLIQIPDKQLLSELTQQVQKNQTLMISDLRRYFYMLSCLFSVNDKPIKKSSVHLYRMTFSKLLKVELEQSWVVVSRSLIMMAGEEDEEMRKIARGLILQIIDSTNNANIVLQKLYYQGMENESILVMQNSIRIILKILEGYSSILHNKSSINVVKLILEKIILLALSSKHIELEKRSRQFLNSLFYMKIDRMDEVLDLLHPQILGQLEKIWSKNKEAMLTRQQQQKQSEMKKNVEIKYEHLPLINGKFFGIYEPYVLKNIFNPEIPAAKYMSIKHFREIYEGQEQNLQKYINVIFKIVVRFAPQQNYDLLMMLKKIVSTPGKNNIINVSIVPGLLIPQLENENVMYRRELRQIMKIIHFDCPDQSLLKYSEELEKDTNMGWIKTCEIFTLLEHWIDNNMERSYPPTLNPFLLTICKNTTNTQVKVRDKSLELLLTIVDRYPGYRENLDDIFTPDQIAEIQDIIEARKNKGKATGVAIEAQQIFMKQYQEERNRFIEHKNKNKKEQKKSKGK